MVSSILEAVELVHRNVKKREHLIVISYNSYWKEFYVNHQKTDFLPPLSELEECSQFVSKAYEIIQSQSSESDSSDEMKRQVMRSALYNLCAKANSLIKKGFDDLKRNQRKQRQKELLEMLEFLQNEGTFIQILNTDPKLAEFLMRVGLLDNSSNMEVLLLIEQKINALRKAG